MAPFKFSPDYIDILGGFESDKYFEFTVLFTRAFKDARKHAERIITLVELMQKGSRLRSLSLSSVLTLVPILRTDSNLPCFANGALTLTQLRERFQLTLTASQIDDFCNKLILSSMMSNFTRLYE